MKIATVKKQPGEKRRWAIDYEDAVDSGDILYSVSNVVDPSGPTVTTTLNGDYIVRISVDGGTDGITYKITCTVTTTGSNEIFEDEFYVKVKEI